MTRPTPSTDICAAQDSMMFSKMEVIDIPAVASSVADLWFNQALCGVNGSVVRLGVIQGEYHWHKHDHGDELFVVLAGELFIDLDERSVALKAWQGFVIRKGARHRTRANRRTVILMMEQSGTEPAGD